MDKDGQTALHLACINGRKDDIKTLLSAGADVNKLSKEGDSPLMLLARSESLGSECRHEYMKLLIDSGANVKITGREGRQAIHSVIFSRDAECVKLLLENGADSSAVLASNERKKSLLHIAALENLPEIARLLVAHKADLNARDGLLMTALMVAAINHSVDVLRILLDAGADVSKKAENGMSVLHISALAEHKRSAETVRMLCEAGVPMDTKDDRGMCAIHYHIDFQRNSNLKMLLESGCDVDLRCHAGFTPLMRTCSACNSDDSGHLELVRTLLAAGADVNAKNSNGNTALSFASGKKNPEVVRALLVDPKCDVNVRDEQGDTPLHEAAMANHPGTVRLLLNGGADANACNAQGETPLFSAAQHGYAKVAVEFLRDDGATTKEHRTGARDVAARKGHQDVVVALQSGDGSVEKLTSTLNASTINA